MPRRLSKIYRHGKFWIKVFFDKELSLYAASLSYHTIFTIIPLLLLIFTLLISLDGFLGYYESVKSFIFSNLLPIHSEVIMGHIDDFLANSKQIGAYGLGVVFFSSLFFFRNFIYITNKIFHAPQRGFFASFGLYIFYLIFTPITLGLSLYITGYVVKLMAANQLTDGLNILPFIPYLITWVFLFFIMFVSANTRVYIKAAFISSFVAAAIFSISKNLFIYYVFMSKMYETIYGSFAVVMFVFLWIYVSWLIVIYGLKLCYVINRIYKKREAV